MSSALSSVYTLVLSCNRKTHPKFTHRCTVAERVARVKVERVSHLYPTGPIATDKRKDGFGQMKTWTHLKGKNEFSLRAPDDDKAWVGVYHYLEKITKEAFYFGFQTGTNAQGVVGRFINQNIDKFTFGQAYRKTETDLVPCTAEGMSVRGGCVLVTAGGEVNVSPVPLTITSSRILLTGTHRIICRLFVPGSGGARGNRDATSYRLGSIGIIRTNQLGDGPTTAWAQREDIMESWIREEVIVGLEYKADERELVIHGNSHLSRSSRFNSNVYGVAETPGDLYIAAELTTKAANVSNTLLSIREVDGEEWASFLEHTQDLHPLVIGGNAANGLDELDVEAMEAANGADRGVDRRVVREAIRMNRRRERDDGNGGNLQGWGRRVARALLPRNAAPPNEPGGAAAAEEVDQAPLLQRPRRVVHEMRQVPAAAFRAGPLQDAEVIDLADSDSDSDDTVVEEGVWENLDLAPNLRRHINIGDHAQLAMRRRFQRNDR